MMASRKRAPAWVGIVAGAGVTLGLVAVAFLADLDAAGQLVGVVAAVVAVPAFVLSVHELVGGRRTNPRSGSTATAVAT